jgi:hypothetical protein
MKEDPIVEEARAAGQAYIDRFNGDWKALAADLNERAAAAGRKSVSLPPRSPRCANEVLPKVVVSKRS